MCTRRTVVALRRGAFSEREFALCGSEGSLPVRGSIMIVWADALRAMVAPMCSAM
jgi:hypothetical protein